MSMIRLILSLGFKFETHDDTLEGPKKQQGDQASHLVGHLRHTATGRSEDSVRWIRTLV